MKSIGLAQPLVSVIMPTYNHARFIGEAIESVLNQTYQNLEVIIIDNYSEDGTEAIVSSYRDERIRYLKLRNHGVIAASRNHGMRHAQGDYIAFVDSDDLWEPTKIEKQVQLLEENEKYFLVYTAYKVINKGIECKVLPKKKHKKSGIIFIPLFLSYNFIGLSTVVFRNVSKEGVFIFDTDIKLRAVEDYDLWLRIAKNKQIAYIDEPLAVYRLHGQNTSDGIASYVFRNLKVTRKYQGDVNIALLITKYFMIFMTVCLLMIKKLYTGIEVTK